ncbi:MAG: M20/M25/M40 family metallo-hydrolase [Anaerovoracaceae bacterium]
MKPEISARIKEIALELTAVQSIVDTKGEVEVSDKVYEIISKMEYWQKHPENLYFVPVKDDPLGRKVVVSILRGEKKPSDKTVVLIGHTDTVGISDYGPLQEFATQPYELEKRLREVTLPEEAREDLESGKYMFGRGLFDMKSGDAAVMALMEDISKDVENFEGNIIFGAVCDEEGNSRGMLNFVPELIRLKEAEGFDYLALIDPDYVAPAYPGDPLKYVYVGTVGKLMPSFFIVGKETHVGESFDGLDPNQIAAEITRRVNLNPEFCDAVDGFVTLPPVTLKQRDLKPEYSVQIAKTANIFFNYATHVSTPDQVLAKMKAAGQECFQNVVDTINDRYRVYCEMIDREYKPQPWVARTMVYEEVYNAVKAEVGDKLDDMIAEYVAELTKDETIDVRDKSMKIVEYVHSLWSDKDPVLVLYYTPPYYPHIYVEGKRPKEQALIDAVRKAIDTTETEYEIIEKRFLPCISDLSYAAAPSDPKVIEKLQCNTPGYGDIYELPLDDMQKLDLPVVDIGTVGKDAHKFTERIDTRYTFEITPELIYKTMMELLK